MIGIALIAEGHLHVLFCDFPFPKALALRTHRFYIIHGFHKPWIKNVQRDPS